MERSWWLCAFSYISVTLSLQSLRFFHLANSCFMSFNPEDFDRLHLTDPMALTRARGRAETRYSIINSIRPTGEDMEYKLDIQEDDRGEQVAWKAMSRPTHIDLNGILLEGRKLTVALREQVTVTIKQLRNGGVECKCSCSDWDEHSPCSVRPTSEPTSVIEPNLNNSTFTGPGMKSPDQQSTSPLKTCPIL